MDKQALTLEEAGKLVGVSYPTIRALANSAGFPAFKIGRKWIVPKEALMDWLTRQAYAKKSV